MLASIHKCQAMCVCSFIYVITLKFHVHQAIRNKFTQCGWNKRNRGKSIKTIINYFGVCYLYSFFIKFPIESLHMCRDCSCILPQECKWDWSCVCSEDFSHCFTHLYISNRFESDHKLVWLAYIIYSKYTVNRVRQSTVCLANGNGLDDRRVEVWVLACPRILCFSCHSDTLGPIQTPVEWVLGALSMRVKLTTHQ